MIGDRFWHCQGLLVTREPEPSAPTVIAKESAAILNDSPTRKASGVCQ